MIFLTKIQESMNQGNDVESGKNKVSHNGNPLECRGGGGRGGGLLRREVYRGEEAVRRSEVGPALCLCGRTDGGEKDFFPNLRSTTFFYEISVRSTFGRMEAWSPIVRIPSPPSILGALDRKSRNSLKEPELVRSGKSLESLAFAMLYDQGHIKFTDRLAKYIILSCNNISQSETSNTWYRLLCQHLEELSFVFPKADSVLARVQGQWEGGFFSFQITESSSTDKAFLPN